MTSEMEVFFQVCPCPVIAVTGSDGKTTTTTLIAEMLQAAGKTVWVGGNIGKPLLPEAERMAPSDWAVVELSSFQLMDMDRERPHCRGDQSGSQPSGRPQGHGGVCGGQEACVLLPGSRGRPGPEWGQCHHPELCRRGPRGRFAGFRRQGRPDRGVYLEDGVLYRAAPSGPQAIMAQTDILLPGMHNVENYMTALAAVEGLVSDETARQVAQTFGGVEHRIELVRELDGVRWYNDSIASSPSRTIAGRRSFPQKVILIAGGYDKHIPYDALGPEICRHVKRLIVTGATGEKIRQAVLAAPEYREYQPEILFY